MKFYVATIKNNKNMLKKVTDRDVNEPPSVQVIRTLAHQMTAVQLLLLLRLFKFLKEN